MSSMHPVLPERGSGPKERVEYLDVAAACRAEPGAWFLVATKDSEPAAWALSAKIKSGRRAAFRPAGLFRSYTEAGKVFAMYARTPMADPRGGSGADPR